MNHAWVMAGVLIGSITAGCIGQDGQQEPAFATAQEVLGRATLQAEAWAGSPVLYGVQGLEPGESIYDQADDPTVSALWRHTDPHVGDGKTQAWMYQFVSAEKPNRFLAVVALSDGRIHAAVEGNAAGLGTFTEPELGAWNIDSDEATRIASNKIENWNQVLEDLPQALLTMNLARPSHQEHPYWIMAVREPMTFLELTSAAIDATTGQVVPVDELVRILRQVGGAFRGNLTMQLMEADIHLLSVPEEGHKALHANLQVHDPDPGSSIEVTLTPPHGPSHTFAVSNDQITPDGPSHATLRIEDPPRGRWSVTIALEDGFSEDYEFTWCVEGDISGLGSGYCPQAPRLGI